MERPGSSVNSKKSSLYGLTSNDEAIYSASCPAQSNVGQINIGVDKLNGWPVKVLRDTGCTRTIVERAFFQLNGDTRQFRFAADGRPHSDRCAAGQCLPASPIVQRTLQSDVSQLPVYPVMIVNMRGVRQMLLDWKAETRKELELGPVQATTMTMTTKAVICLVGCLKTPTARSLRRET